MLRLMLWMVLGFIVWKMIRLASAMTRRPKDPGEPEPPFVHIEEAQFEDLDKQPPDSSTPQQDH